MPRTPKKRGRPRKYGTLKDKTEVSPPTASQDIESYETNPLGDPPEADSSLNHAESPTSSIDAVVPGGEQSPQSIEGNDLVSPCLQLLGNTSGQHTLLVKLEKQCRHRSTVTISSYGLVQFLESATIPQFG
ncbi:hypothetical protein DER44DRAFT_890743 [Fusarium oxysporum]|nr:hypothetical protein DER44DRAFT_890743 [Fusarium oxysporum]